MTREAIIAVSNDIVNDQRVRRMALVLKDCSYTVRIIGRQLPHSSELKDDDFVYHRFKMIFKKGFLFYKWLNVRIFFYLLRRKPSLFISVDLDTLLPFTILARMKSVPLIYDAHEYFTGTPELLKRRFVRSIWKRIERYSFSRLINMITVNESIAALYETEYGIKPVVVRNISKKPERSEIKRSELGIDENSLLLVIQGTGINLDRGGLEAIKAVELFNNEDNRGNFPLYKDVHLLVIGDGDELPSMRDYVFENNLFDNITFLAPMEWQDMMNHTQLADIGLSLDSSESINYRYSLPNKIFDYLNAGLAILATDLPELAKIVKPKKCGILISDNKVESICSGINAMLAEEHLLDKFKNNSTLAAMTFDWDKEKEILKGIIEEAELNK